MKEPEGENSSTGEIEDSNERESSRREEDALDHSEVQLSHVQPNFNMDPQSSPGEGRSPFEGNPDRPEAGVWKWREWGKNVTSPQVVGGVHTGRAISQQLASMLGQTLANRLRYNSTSHTTVSTRCGTF